MPNHASLLRTLTLGTARQSLDPAINAWLEERDAVDPTADEAERLLAAWAVTERMHRIEAGQKTDVPTTSTAPPDDRKLPSGKISRGVQLVMRGTYPRLMPEVLRLLAEKDIQFPPFLLPDLLELAVTKVDGDPELTASLLTAAGPRGRWLAGLNPDWSILAADYTPATEWPTEATPGGRLTLLRRWRRQDPTAAREALAMIWKEQSPKNQESLLSALEVNLSQEDIPWLRNQLGPKRRGVRRMLFRLLLQAGEEQALNDATTLAAASLTDDGKIGSLLNDDNAKALLVDYGGLAKKESLANFLLDVLPPNVLPDLTGRTGKEFWNTLPKAELTTAANTLLRYDAPELKSEFVRFACIINPAQLPVLQAAKLTAKLPQEVFLTIFHELLEKEKNVLYAGGVPRILVLSREEPWSERITKAFIFQLIRSLKDVYALPHRTQRDLQDHWRLSIPLLHRSSFGWLRTQLHAMTERTDSFGKLATDTLQTTAFRRMMWES